MNANTNTYILYSEKYKQLYSVRCGGFCLRHKSNKTDLVDQLCGLLNPCGLVIIENTVGAAEREGISVSTGLCCTGFYCFLPSGEQALPFELHLALEVLEEDEVLQEDVPPEVAVAELQVHQLGGEKRHNVRNQS